MVQSFIPIPLFWSVGVAAAELADRLGLRQTTAGRIVV